MDTNAAGHRDAWKGGAGWVQRYRTSLAVGVVGCAASLGAAFWTHSWAAARDRERFAAECDAVTARIEQKMERYESMLGRLRDACALNGGEIAPANWTGWLETTLDWKYDYPNLLCVAVAPRVHGGEKAKFLRRAKERSSGYPDDIATTRSNATEWCPVWLRAMRRPGPAPALGDDLLAEGPERPSFARVLGDPGGWISERPYRLPASSNQGEIGFWFANALHPTEFTNRVTWQRRGESDAAASARRWGQRAGHAQGLLVAFIGGNLFLAEFNRTNALARIQLYASREAEPAALLNPGHARPTHSRFVEHRLMPWYGRRWRAEFRSLPLFDSGSLQYRAWLIGGVGMLLALGASAAVAGQTRGLEREARLAGELREALARQERMSRDLHDGTLQSVYGVGLSLQRARRSLPGRPDEAAKRVVEAGAALQQVVDELRRFIRDHDCSAREEVCLGRALAGVLDQLRSATELRLETDVPEDAGDGLAPHRALHLLNVAREALSNALRHARASCIRVVLRRDGSILRLEVSDDGRGFDPATALDAGHGLRNLAARVRELGAMHRWDTAPGRGTRLVVEVPMDPPAGGAS